MAACRETEDANLLRVDSPFRGSRAHGTNGPLAIHHGHWVHVTGGVHAIFEHEGGNAERIQPVRDIVALVRNSEVAVTSAGKDDYGCLRARTLWSRHIHDGFIGRFRRARSGSTVFPEANGTSVGC